MTRLATTRGVYGAGLAHRRPYSLSRPARSRIDGGFAVPTADPTLDRLIRHMAWANAALFARLATCSDEDLGLAAPRNEWAVARILAHLVSAAGRYAARLEGLPRGEEAQPPTTLGELAGLAALSAGYDARLRAQVALPDGPASYAEPD